MKLRIFGRVQGIGFRRLVKKFCLKNKICGYAKNISDGSVLIVADKTTKLIEWLKANPGFSKIEEIKSEKSDGEVLNDFEIIKKDNFFVDKFKAIFNLIFFRRGIKDVPNHLAIIPDGNRRWAKKRGMLGTKGHEKAGEVENLVSLFEEAKNFGVKYISFWGFSTENWKRGKSENEKLFEIFLRAVKGIKEYASQNKIRFRHIGRKDRFPKELIDAIINLEEETKNYSDYNIQFCLDYGGRDEILRGVNKLLGAKAKSVSEKQFSEILDTKGIPEPDLIVRTSGEKRLSGFMPWQGVYAELIFLKKHFPSFKPRDVRSCIKEFSKRKRRFGGGS